MSSASVVAGGDQQCFPVAEDMKRLLGEESTPEAFQAAVERAKQLLAEAYSGVLDTAFTAMTGHGISAPVHTGRSQLAPAENLTDRMRAPAASPGAGTETLRTESDPAELPPDLSFDQNVRVPDGAHQAPPSWVRHATVPAATDTVLRSFLEEPRFAGTAPPSVRPEPIPPAAVQRRPGGLRKDELSALARLARDTVLERADQGLPGGSEDLEQWCVAVAEAFKDLVHPSQDLPRTGGVRGDGTFDDALGQHPTAQRLAIGAQWTGVRDWAQIAQVLSDAEAGLGAGSMALVMTRSLLPDRATAEGRTSLGSPGHVTIAYRNEDDLFWVDITRSPSDLGEQQYPGVRVDNRLPETPPLQARAVVINPAGRVVPGALAPFHASTSISHALVDHATNPRYGMPFWGKKSSTHQAAETPQAQAARQAEESRRRQEALRAAYATIDPALKGYVERDSLQADYQITESFPFPHLLRNRQPDGRISPQELIEFHNENDRFYRDVRIPRIQRGAGVFVDGINDQDFKILARPYLSSYPELQTYMLRADKSSQSARNASLVQHTITHNRVRLTFLHSREDDPLRQSRIDLIRKAVSLVQNFGYPVHPDLKIYLPTYYRRLDVTRARDSSGAPMNGLHITATSADGAQSVHQVASFGSPNMFILTPAALAAKVENGDGDYSFVTVLENYGLGVVLHEFMHAAAWLHDPLKDADTLRTSISGPENKAAIRKVGTYALSSPKEAVAEIMVGRMYGRTFDHQTEQILDRFTRAVGGADRLPGSAGALVPVPPLDGERLRVLTQWVSDDVGRDVPADVVREFDERLSVFERHLLPDLRTELITKAINAESYRGPIIRPTTTDDSAVNGLLAALQDGTLSVKGRTVLLQQLSTFIGVMSDEQRTAYEGLRAQMSPDEALDTTHNQSRPAEPARGQDEFFSPETIGKGRELHRLADQAQTGDTYGRTEPRRYEWKPAVSFAEETVPVATGRPGLPLEVIRHPARFTAEGITSLEAAHAEHLRTTADGPALEAAVATATAQAETVIAQTIARTPGWDMENTDILLTVPAEGLVVWMMLAQQVANNLDHRVKVFIGGQGNQPIEICP